MVLIGKRMMKIIDLNEIVFTDLVLSTIVSQTIDYEDGHAGLYWEKKKKYNPVSVLSLGKTERLFRESKLVKDEDNETWITNLEDLRSKLEAIGLFMIDDQFIVQILNRLKVNMSFICSYRRSRFEIKKTC
jgi:hypothetical protein